MSEIKSPEKEVENVVENIVEKVEEKVEDVVTSSQIIIDGVEYETYDEHVFSGCMLILNKRLQHIEICFENMMAIVRLVMEVVETTKKKGEEQKKLAVKLVKKIIVDSPISDSKEKLLLDICDTGLLSATIDLVVAASKGELSINVVKKSCFKKCFPF